jgi:transposase-like protein
VVSERKRPHTRYTEEIKAAALADVVLLGTSATAAKYGIPRTTLLTWQQQFTIVHNPSLKREYIGGLVAAYLEANLQALTAQAYVSSDPEYINRQPAEGLAILHGVMADKSVRLLEAISRGRTEPATLDGE